MRGREVGREGEEGEREGGREGGREGEEGEREGGREGGKERRVRGREGGKERRVRGREGGKERRVRGREGGREGRKGSKNNELKYNHCIIHSNRVYNCGLKPAKVPASQLLVCHKRVFPAKFKSIIL